MFLKYWCTGISFVLTRRKSIAANLPSLASSVWELYFFWFHFVFTEISGWSFASQISCQIWTLPYGGGEQKHNQRRSNWCDVKEINLLMLRVLMVLFLFQILAVGNEVEELEPGKKVWFAVVLLCFFLLGWIFKSDQISTFCLIYATILL